MASCSARARACWCSRRSEGARERGARILGRLAGYASTSDAYHLTAPEPGGRGAARAIGLALADAGVEPADVDYVNAHGTSTPLNDRAETEAIKAALGERASAVPVSSTKSAIGHLLGAAGAVEAIATLLALRDRIAPPTLGYEEPDEGLDLDYVPGKARPLAGRRRARGGNLERVRLRRPQRGALHRGAVSGGLDGKRLVITGVLTRGSIAFAVAERAQEDGAELVLTSFGRARRLTERAAAKLPDPPDVLELDVNSGEDFEALAAELESRWGAVDGALHAVAFAPADALGGGFLDTPPESAEEAFRTSAFSFKAMGSSLAPLMQEGGSLVGMTFDASVAWPVYDWMGVSKAALESVSRYLARDLGGRGVRVNLVAAGPGLHAGGGRHPRLRSARLDVGGPGAARLGPEDAAPVAEAVCFLLSDRARAISGEILHVDGGFHAMGAPLEL